MIFNHMVSKTRLISDKELYDSIVNLIKNSENDINISSPWIYNCDHILNELITANRKGVKISVVMRDPKKDFGDKNYQDKLNAIEKLKEAKADIIFDPYLHEKVVISDGKEIIISSANLIGTSLTRNGESGTYTDDTKEIYKYQLRLVKKYGKKLAKTNNSIVTKPIFKGLAVVVVTVIILVLFVFRPPSDGCTYTVSSLLNEKPLNEIVIVCGLVVDAPEDYTAKTSGNLYQQFYITDGSKQIKVFCSKDAELKISKHEKVEVTGKFIIFDNEYEVTDFNCSKIIKK